MASLPLVKRKPLKPKKAIDITLPHSGLGLLVFFNEPPDK